MMNQHLLEQMYFWEVYELSIHNENSLVIRKFSGVMVQK